MNPKRTLSKLNHLIRAEEDIIDTRANEVERLEYKNRESVERLAELKAEKAALLNAHDGEV